MADIAGQRRIELAPAKGGDSLFSVRARIFGDSPVDLQTIRMSLNQVATSADAQVRDGDEVAFFSMFSGG